MADGWYVQRDGKEIGPISEDDLRSFATRGRLSPDDLVWQKSLNEWTRAGDCTGLFSSSQATDNGDASTRTATRPPDQLAVLQVEKAKIQSSSLPRSYAEFGKAFYERVDHAVADSVPQELVPLIKQIDGPAVGVGTADGSRNICRSLQACEPVGYRGSDGKGDRERDP
jgi:hypothetical protein